jgi:CubicO group peptidase (beta-lactamase class C family)
MDKPEKKKSQITKLKIILIITAVVIAVAAIAAIAFLRPKAQTDPDLTERIAETETDENIYSGLTYDETNNTWSTEDEELKKFAGIMRRECAKSPEIKGTFLLATDDRIIFIGGINSKDTSGNKVDATTIYEIGSITKMFTATAVLQLNEQGKLSLDDTLDMYFPEFKNGKDITLCQLLHMRSGLRRDFVTEDDFLDMEKKRDVEEFRRYFYDGYSDEELLSMLFDDEPEFTPGSDYSYSNTGYTLLAMIIEKVTGESFGEYVRKNIFDVCKMKESSSMTTGDVTSIPEYVPNQEYPIGDPYEIVDTLYTQLKRTYRGAGDIHSSAGDLLAFDRALIGGKLISEQSLAEMFRTDEGYGCGWMEHPHYEDVYVHGGETYCYLGYNLWCKTEKYGNLYLIQLHPTVAGDNFSNECMQNIIVAARM